MKHPRLTKLEAVDPAHDVFLQAIIERARPLKLAVGAATNQDGRPSLCILLGRKGMSLREHLAALALSQQLIELLEADAVPGLRDAVSTIGPPAFAEIDEEVAMIFPGCIVRVEGQ